MTRDDKHAVFMFVGSYVLLVLFILSYPHFRQSPNVIRVLVFGTLAGVLIGISMVWNRSGGPPSSGSSYGSFLTRTRESTNFLNRSRGGGMTP